MFRVFIFSFITILSSISLAQVDAFYHKCVQRWETGIFDLIKVNFYQGNLVDKLESSEDLSINGFNKEQCHAKLRKSFHTAEYRLTCVCELVPIPPQKNSLWSILMNNVTQVDMAIYVYYGNKQLDAYKDLLVRYRNAQGNAADLELCQTDMLTHPTCSES